MKKYDFSGYATRNDLKCSDGRTIRKDAFKDNNGTSVPLVWQHIHNEPGNVLGHGVLENREDGVYVYGVFNNSEAGKTAKQLVEHGDITALSIFANGLVQKGKDVIHGAIREVSLVLAGANPGALIDNLSIEHGDGSYEEDATEAVIYTGEEFEKDTVEHAAGEKTVKEVFDSMSKEQKDVVYFMIGAAIEADDDDEEDVTHSDEGGEEMKKNVFDATDNDDKAKRATLTHDQLQTILADAQQCGSLRDSFLSHAVEYGIENIDYLFPDARTITASPDFIMREQSWVPGVISGTYHTPFSRIKSTAADITADEARAKGYVKGNLKKEEIIKLLKRVTTPTTVYKKQKLDRDDIIDITDLDVVGWLKAEMRMMLDEELARAILVGDGRDPASEEAINTDNIRPIYIDDDMYAHHIELPATDEEDYTIAEIIEDIIKARKFYKGSGSPAFYTYSDILTDMLLVKDKMGRRLYNTETELASALRVSKIVEVPVMEDLTRSIGVGPLAHDVNLIGILVNLKDYNVGADKGGAISMFDDFDIDYNQYKYLIETRCSGALIRPKAALVIEQAVAEVVAG